MFDLKVRARRAGIALLVGSLAFTMTSTHAAAATPIDRIFVFSDSYADNGRGAALSYLAVENRVKDAVRLPAEPNLGWYWEGFWSNGPTAVEDLATTLKVPTSNYAVGGAKSDSTNYYPWMDAFNGTGLQAQVKDFEKYYANKDFSRDALFYVGISANDFFAPIDTDAWADANYGKLGVDAAVNTEKAIKELYTFGARRFLVSYAYDLENAPAVTAVPDKVAKAKTFEEQYNKYLSQALTAADRDFLGAKILRFDWGGQSRDIAQNASQYGFTNTTQPCQPVIPTPPKAACNKTDIGQEDKYMWWDEYHPACKLAEILAGRMTTLVDEAEWP